MTTAVPPDDEYAPARTSRAGSGRPDKSGPPPGRHKRVPQAGTDRQPEFSGYRQFDAGSYGRDNGGGYTNGSDQDGDRGNGTATLVRERRPAPVRRTQPPSRARRWRPPLPLVGVLALQAVISLSLVFGNTAYADEANYLWTGQLELDHWLHGTPLLYVNALPGSSYIYPPLGALASDIGGLAGARIFSLLLMLGATTMLYSAAARLFGRRAAIAAAVLWAVSVAALKIGAYATFDALAVFFLCLAAWLAVQAGFRRRSAELAILAALAILAGDLTAYSYVIYDIPIIVFAFCVWNLRYGTRRAGALTLWLVASLVTLGFIIPTVGGMWSGIVQVGFGHKLVVNLAPQSYATIAESEWEWAGLVTVLGATGAIAAVAGRANRRVIALLAVLAAAAFVVPLYQFHLRTVYTLDEHLAGGIWLAAMPAGYLVARVARIARPSHVLAGLAALAVVAFPTASGWTAAYSDYQSWPNAARLVALVRPLVETPHKYHLYAEPTGAAVLNYYTGDESRGPRWNTGPLISVDPTNVPISHWQGYFQTGLNTEKYYVIALELPVASTEFLKAGGGLQKAGSVAGRLTSLAKSQPGDMGLYEFAADVVASGDYKLVGVVPYTDHLKVGTFLVWQRTATTAKASHKASHKHGRSRKSGAKK